MRPGTIGLRLYYLDRVSADLGALDTLTCDDLLAWLASQEWAPETRKSARGALCGFYHWAVDNGHLAADPSSRLPPVRVPPGVPKPAPTAVLQRALKQASDRDRLMLELAAYAGLRRSEIATLPWAAIGWQGLRVVGKGGRARLIPLARILRNDLDAERARREVGCWGTGWRYTIDPASRYVFPGLTGSYMSPETVGALLAQLLGGGWSGHCLRHRFASRAYSVERDLLVVQQLLGHSKPETTARYVAVPHGAARKAVNGAVA
jgi:site-specific recombinase XerD